MMVSSDFLIRMMGPSVPQLPVDKGDLIDVDFEGFINKLGGHQKFLDISRCYKLSTLPFKCLSQCSSLVFLDVSYTGFRNLTVVCESCPCIKGLNLAGLSIDEGYEDLWKLDLLELIIFRSSNVSSLKPLEKLNCLRSIDLGHTSIDLLEPLRNKDRLEELLLDYCNITEVDNKPRESILSIFQSLPKLKFINCVHSNIQHLSDFINQDFAYRNRLVFFDKTSKREQYFRAVMENDHIETFNILSSGQDINMRAHPDDLQLFLDIWKQKCFVSFKLKTPFFLCDHPRPELRPSAYHLGLFFNCYETLHILRDLGVSHQAQVWFGEVTDESIQNNTLVQTAGLIEHVGYEPEGTAGKLKTTTSNIVSGKGLIAELLERNVHRLSTGMMEQKILNWKSLCVKIQRQLLYLQDTVSAKTRMSLEELNESLNFKQSKDEEIEEQESSNTISEEITSSEPIRRRAGIIGGKSKKKKVFFEEKETDIKQDFSIPVFAGIKGVSTEKNIDNVKIKTTENEQKADDKFEVEKMKLKIIPRLSDHRRQWRSHLMVRKLTGNPLVAKIPCRTKVKLSHFKTLQATIPNLSSTKSSFASVGQTENETENEDGWKRAGKVDRNSLLRQSQVNIVAEKLKKLEVEEENTGDDEWEEILYLGKRVKSRF